MKLAWIGLALSLSGCVIPFVHSHREKPQTPKAVLRFWAQAQSLTTGAGAPGLPELTRSMSIAIDALPDVKGGDQLTLEVRKQAEAMTQRPNETDALARMSLGTALEAVRRAKSSVPQGDKDQAIEAAHQAIQKVEPGQRATIDLAYREAARTMTGRATASSSSS